MENMKHWINTRDAKLQGEFPVEYIFVFFVLNLDFTAISSPLKRDDTIIDIDDNQAILNLFSNVRSEDLVFPETFWHNHISYN